MQLNIVSFVKNLIPSFNKSDILSDLETSIDYLDTVSISNYNNFISAYSVNDIKTKDVKKLITEFYKNYYKVKPHIELNNKEFFKDSHTLLSNVVVNANYINVELDKVLNDVVVSHALSLYKSYLLRAVAHISFIAKFSTDLLNYIYIKETNDLVDNKFDDDFYLNKIQYSNIEDNLWIYARLIAFYGLDENRFNKLISNAPDQVLSKDNIEQVVSLYNISDVEILPSIPHGFIGSPIYSIRLMFAQWESKRYRELKDKKKLLELRYLHYKLLKENGQSDIAVEKEINYLQKRITDIDYELSKMEEAING